MGVNLRVSDVYDRPDLMCFAKNGSFVKNALV